MKKKRILIVGGGAAGTMAAIAAAEQGAQVVLLERNARIARKVMITGKGRCNLTNDCDLDTFIASVPTNGRFLYSAFSHFTSQAVMDFFTQNGLPLKVERGNRVFPQSDRAVDVVDTLAAQLKRLGVVLLEERVKQLLVEDGMATGVVGESGKAYEADAVILCTGGCSYSATGSTGDGYILAKQAGHSVIAPRPSLVPLESGASWCKELQGLSLRNVAIRLIDTTCNKIIYTDFGEMLFTHFGISGPIILSASTHMEAPQDGRYAVAIDLKPALQEEQLDARLQRDFAKYSNKDYSNALQDLLPHKLIPVFVRLSGISEHCKANQITREMRKKIAVLLKSLIVPVSGFRPLEEAIVTSGGICVKEVSPKTMESKLTRGLYFAGELLDVDAYTGGFNLQIAWSTGRLAGISAAERG